MTNRTSQKLVVPIFFLPVFLSTLAVFYWSFELLRTYSYAAAYDRMSLVFEVSQDGLSELAWEQFATRYQIGIYSGLGILGGLILVGCALYLSLRLRQFQLMAGFARSSAVFDQQAQLMKTPIGFWTDCSVRIILGLLLIAISLVIGATERKRDAFEMAQTEIVYPDIEWNSNIEFTVGLLGCFVLSSSVFLLARLNLVMFDEEELATVKNTSPIDELANWEAAVRR